MYDNLIMDYKVAVSMRTHSCYGFVCPQGNDLEPTDSTFLSSTKLTMSTH
jgi:hypothetical protein